MTRTQQPQDIVLGALEKDFMLPRHDLMPCGEAPRRCTHTADHFQIPMKILIKFPALPRKVVAHYHIYQGHTVSV